MFESTSHGFNLTRWSLVDMLRSGAEQDRVAAINELCRLYMKPLYVYARQWGMDHHEAEDAVQNFVIHAVNHNLFGRADRASGRLRAWLKVALNRHLCNHHAKQSCQKRGGDVKHVALEDLSGADQARLVSAETMPDDAYNKVWAFTLLERCLIKLEKRYEKVGRQEQFKVMRSYLPYSQEKNSSERQEEDAAALSMKESTFRGALLRMREQYMACIIDEVRQTVGTYYDAVIQQELKELYKSLTQ